MHFTRSSVFFSSLLLLSSLSVGTNGIADKQAAMAAQIQPGPVNLVQLAYQGALEDQGIPKAATLLRQVRFNQIKAEDVVMAGIDAGRIPASTLDNQSYLRVVQTELEELRDFDFDNN
jgi:hypothetical protein